MLKPKFKRADGKDYEDERDEQNSSLRLSVQARLIAHERIKEREEKRRAAESRKKDFAIY